MIILQSFPYQQLHLYDDSGGKLYFSANEVEESQDFNALLYRVSRIENKLLIMGQSDVYVPYRIREYYVHLFGVNYVFVYNLSDFFNLLDAGVSINRLVYFPTCIEDVESMLLLDVKNIGASNTRMINLLSGVFKESKLFTHNMTLENVKGYISKIYVCVLPNNLLNHQFRWSKLDGIEYRETKKQVSKMQM